MNSQAATIDGGPVLNEQVAPAVTRGGAMKFLYASGSRPLDGYTVKRGIGRGGFGEVYFATSDAGKELALKHVERNLEVELRGVSQCLNLKHVNLVDLYDVRYDEQGDAWVVMEYVGGPSLKDVIDRNPNGLPLDEVNRWFRGLAAGTAYLHDHGIVHRDLKPGNVFDDDGVVKIGDYGLSKFISTSRRSGQTESVGTFHYMAPEIGKGVYGKEIDIYALGIILFEMLTGSVPFEGESSQEIIMKHLTADPNLTDIPVPYRAVIERALQKDPEKRYASVDEMLAAFSGQRVPASPGLAASPRPAAVPPKRVRDEEPVEYRIAPDSPPLYIGDEEEGIEFGPLTEVVDEKSPAGKKGRRPRPADEPIAKAFVQSCRRIGRWWAHGPLNTPLKIVLLVAVAVLAIINIGWLVPAAIVLGSVYCVYLGIRLISGGLAFGSAPRVADAALAAGTAAAGAAASTAASPGMSPQRTAQSFSQNSAWNPQLWEQKSRQLLQMKTAGDRIGELTGSMLAAALISAVLTIAMTAIGGEQLDDSAHPMAGPAWLWVSATLGSWLVLAAGKFFESSPGEQAKRRFAMLAAGLVFGLLSYLTSQFLMVRMLDGIGAREFVIADFGRHMFGADGSPGLAAFLAYFGAVFLTIGWWKQTDPLRSSRLQIGSILVALAVAWGWWLLFAFPQPWGFMVVTAISISSQLSSPWLSPQERTAALTRV
jgi:hypothetical protein